MKKGLLITLEGGEGIGKTTQVEFVKKWFEDHNISCITTKEPGGTPIGDDLRKILKTATYEFTPKCELLMFNACRAELIARVIKPAINNGINVICDRYIDSSFTYQGYGRGLDQNDVSDICNYATDGIVPDLTLWLDLNPVDAFKRKNGADAGDRLENAGLDFHNRVYEGYKKLNETNKRYRRIDASLSIEEVSAQIDKILSETFLNY